MDEEKNRNGKMTNSHSTLGGVKTASFLAAFSNRFTGKVSVTVTVSG
jgi:hypothetical protein